VIRKLKVWRRDDAPSAPAPAAPSASSQSGEPRPPGAPRQRREPTVAVITMARDEGPMLRLWVDFYSRAVGKENLIVFDDHTVDGSTDDLGVTVHKLPELPGTGFFEPARIAMMNGIAAGLLDVYDYVAFVDVDEFLIPDPAKFPDLKTFLTRRPKRDVIAAMGLNVLHHVGIEDDLDFSRPILEQRQFAKFVPLMCKPSIKRVPAKWIRASHGVDQPYVIDAGIFLLHLKFADRETLRRVADQRFATGRAEQSSWSVAGDEITAMLTDFVGDRHPESVPVFKPQPDRLAKVVREVDIGWKSSGLRQLEAMTRLPLVRIPPRLRGSL